MFAITPRRVLTLATVAALLLASAWLAARLRAASPATLRGTVVRAVDGDTLVVRLSHGDLERVRVIGVDTPEDVAPGRPVECYALRAAAFTAASTTGREVELTPGRERHDRYGRLLAYVRVAGARRTLEDELLRRGLARPLAIAPNVDRAGAYERLAGRARADRRGLWGACT